MNILYLSQLNGASYAGPTYSVPKQIEAQSKRDNVFWYNAIRNDKEEWHDYPFYHNLNEYPKGTIASLPEPFNKPDIIVVELFYNMVRSKFIKELLSGNYTYVIIPRGELTKQAQKRKRLKKTVANLLICNRFARSAAAIQYLTDQEYSDSGDKWNKTHFIIPNGISLLSSKKELFSTVGIKCVSIGRIEPYQKGLDLLIEACSRMKKELRAANCILTICGPDKEGKLNELRQQVRGNGLDDVIYFRDGVFGEDKEKMLLQNDVFLMPSRFEGHPMALIEALSYGIPCLATTGSNMRKEIDECDAGWTADCTVDSISEALYSMLKDKENFFKKGTNSKRLAQKYGWDLIAENTHQVYLKILKIKRGNLSEYLS